jgi:putative membrane protein
LEDIIVMSEKEKSQSTPTKEQAEEAKAPMDMRLRGALVRTAFSSEQTLMSWMRTSVSLFTFGFSITQFFHYLGEQQGGAQLSAGPRRLGLALISLGILALVLGMLEHVHRLWTMRGQGLQRTTQYLLPFGSSAVILAIGILALLSVYFKWSL